MTIPSDDSWVVEYNGPASAAGMLVHMLEAAGIDVEWVPPYERRSAVVYSVAVSIVAAGAYDIIKKVTLDFLMRCPAATAAVEPPGLGDDLQCERCHKALTGAIVKASTVAPPDLVSGAAVGFHPECATPEVMADSRYDFSAGWAWTLPGGTAPGS